MTRSDKFRLALLAGVAAALCFMRPVNAHDVWADGGSVPSWVKSSCCGPADAHLLGADDYWIDAKGFHVRAIDMVVPIDKVLPSMDGRVWVFYDERLGRGATIYCAFYEGSI